MNFVRNKKVHRFITEFTANKGLIELSAADAVHQIAKVLKLRPGEQVIIGKGDGIDVLSKIVRINKNTVYLEPQKNIKNENESSRRVELYCSVLKKENFEAAAQKAVEVGVSKIVPIITKRTVKLNINVVRLKKIIKEAAEQSGRGVVPELGEITEFEKAAQDASGEVKIFFDPSGEKLSPLASDKPNISIFIGPEGGWDDEDINLAKKNNLKIVSLGPLTLRSETAVAVASYLVTHCVDF